MAFVIINLLTYRTVMLLANTHRNRDFAYFTFITLVSYCALHAWCLAKLLYKLINTSVYRYHDILLTVFYNQAFIDNVHH